MFENNEQTEDTQQEESVPQTVFDLFMQKFNEQQQQHFDNLTNSFFSIMDKRLSSEVNQEGPSNSAKKHKASINAPLDNADKSAPEEEVQEPEADYIVPTREDMREQVNRLVQETEPHSEVEEEDSIDLLSPLLLSSKEIVAKGVRPSLATAVDKIWVTPYGDSEKKELFERYKRPENVENLVMHKCNPKIFNSLPSHKRSQDIKTQKVSGSLLTAAHVITGIAEQILNLRENKDLSGNELRKSLGPLVQTSMDSLAALAMANQEVDRGRREDMKSTMNSTFRAFANDIPPSSKLLFGDNIANRINSISANEKIIQKVAPSSSNTKPKQHQQQNRSSKNWQRSQKSQGKRNKGYYNSPKYTGTWADVAKQQQPQQNKYKK